MEEGDDDYGDDANDDGELSFDYGQNDHGQDVVSTSRNSMEVKLKNKENFMELEASGLFSIILWEHMFIHRMKILGLHLVALSQSFLEINYLVNSFVLKVNFGTI